MTTLRGLIATLLGCLFGVAITWPIVYAVSGSATYTWVSSGISLVLTLVVTLLIDLSEIRRSKKSTRVLSEHERHKKYEFKDGCKECDDEFTKLVQGSQGIQG